MMKKLCFILAVLFVLISTLPVLADPRPVDEPEQILIVQPYNH